MSIIPIEDIVTIATANLVIGALLVSLIGATIATAVRHKTSENWKPSFEDVWYYILSGGVGVALAVLGYGTGEILTATTGINTPIAILRTGLEKRRNGTTLQEARALIDKLEALEDGSDSSGSS